MPPEVTTLLHGHLVTRPLEYEHLFDERTLLEGGVDDGLGSDRLAASFSLAKNNKMKWVANAKVSSRDTANGFVRDVHLLGSDQHSTLAILYSVSQGLGRKSSKDGRMDRSDPRTCQERRRCVPTISNRCQLPYLFIHKQGDKRDSPSHGQIDANGISLLDSPSLQDVGDPTRFPQELGIANFPSLTGLVSFVDDGRLVRVGVSVTVEAVVGDVETSFGATKCDREKKLVESQGKEETA